MTRDTNSLFARLRGDERDAVSGLFGESGAAMVEFALLAPVLLLIMLGTAQFGLTLNQYVMLWTGVGAGAAQFVISGIPGTAPTPTPTPASNAWKALTQNAPTLTTKNLEMTLTVNGTACVTGASSLSAAQAKDAACNTALGAIGTPAIVSATYPCNLTVMGHNFFPLPKCNLTAQITELVQ